MKLAANPNNPAYYTVFQPNLNHLYDIKPNAIRPLGLRIKLYLSAADIDTTMVSEIETPPIAPWIFPKPSVNMEMTELKKSKTSPLEYQEKFHNIREIYHSFKFIYTDGSKDSTNTAYAVTSENTNYCSERIPDISSIYTAESTALYKALEIVRDSDIERFVICSDSKSALQAIEHKRLEDPRILDIFMILIHLDHKQIVFCWIPSHIDIKGNDKADSFAKKALAKEITDYTLPYQDFKPLINDFISHCWQLRWNACESNKLHSIIPNITETIHFDPKSRRDQTVLNRCLIGHSRLTHLYLLLANPAPICHYCQSHLTVKHILLECNGLRNRRPYHVSSLYELFRNVSLEVLVQFIRNIGYYHEI